MTCREKLAVEHPEEVGEDYTGGCYGCPHQYRYMDRPENCSFGHSYEECADCWNREIPEEKLQGQRAKLPLIEDNEVPKEIIDGIFAPLDIPVIKDSGDRTEFESGAVRDMREGKGRCDLMPLEVVADLLPCVNEDFKSDHDPMLHDIAAFKQTGDTSWLMAALFNFAIYAYNKSMSTMLLEVSKHYEDGAKKYGENNWQKGMPTWCYIDSAVRHYLKWLRGDRDEPHDRAFVWNLMCCIWEVDYRVKET